MRTLIVITLLIALSLAQYGGAAPAPAAPAPAQYGAAVPVEPDEEDEAAPAPAARAAPGACQLKKRSEAECARIAKANNNCQDCVTSNCKGCQKVFVKYCVNPAPAESVAECLARANEAECPGHTDDDCHAHARQGLAKQCAEQVCADEPAPRAGGNEYVPQPPAPRDDRPRECPAKKPKQDIDIGTIPLPVNHLRGGRAIRDKLNKLSKSLDLLTYTLRLKGLTVDAPCAGKAHVVNLDKFEFPKPAPTPAPAPEAKVELPTGGALAWIHAQTPADVPPGADAATVKKAEYAAATKDIDAIRIKLERTQQARQNVDIEYEAASDFGKITPQEKQQFLDRQNHLQQLEGALKVLYAQSQARQDKNK